MSIPWKTCFRIGVTAVLVFICVHFCDNVLGLLSAFLGALTPIVIGLILAYLLNILMSFYERHYFPKSVHKKLVQKSRRVVCLIMAIVTFCAIIAIIVYLVIPELVSCVKFFISEIPPLIRELLQTEWVQNLFSDDTIVRLTNINWQDYISKIVDFVTSGIGDTVSAIISAVSSIVSGVTTAFLSIIFTIYLLLSRDRLQNQCKRLMNICIRPVWVEKIMYCLSILNTCFHRYIVGQCIEAVILGMLCILGMLILRIPYAAMIGALVGFTALIPVAGAYIGAIVGAVMILTVSPVKALIFLVFLVILQQLENNLIYPKVVGNSIGLPAIWVLMAVTVGGGLFGIAGMLIGVPLAAAIYKLLREVIVTRESSSAISEAKSKTDA